MEYDREIMSSVPSGADPVEEGRIAGDRMREYLHALEIPPDEADALIAEAFRGAGGKSATLPGAMQSLRRILQERGIIDGRGVSLRLADRLPSPAAPEVNRAAMIPQNLEPPWNDQITRVFNRFPLKGLAPFIALIALLIYIFFLF